MLTLQNEPSLWLILHMDMSNCQKSDLFSHCFDYIYKKQQQQHNILQANKSGLAFVFNSKLRTGL